MGYRDEIAAARMRCAALEREFRQAQQHRDQLEHELEAARSLLAQFERRGKNLLENLQIAAPCSADWNEMAGDERLRHCQQCHKNVYNLSAMSPDEAAQLIEEKEGRLCVRLYQRADGTVLHNDCPVGLRARLWRTFRRGIAAVAVALGLVWLRAISATQGPPQGLTGEVAVPMPQPPILLGKLEAPSPRPPTMGIPDYPTQPWHKLSPIKIARSRHY